VKSYYYASTDHDILYAMLAAQWDARAVYNAPVASSYSARWLCQ
jgi:hypothetical protein